VDEIVVLSKILKKFQVLINRSNEKYAEFQLQRGRADLELEKMCT